MTDDQKLIQEAIRSNCGAWFESKHCKIYGKDRNAGLVTPRQNYLQNKVQKVVGPNGGTLAARAHHDPQAAPEGRTTYGAALGYTIDAPRLYVRRSHRRTNVQVVEAWA